MSLSGTCGRVLSPVAGICFQRMTLCLFFSEKLHSGAQNYRSTLKSYSAVPNNAENRSQHMQSTLSYVCGE